MELYYTDLSPPARAVYATAKHLGLPVTLKEVNLLVGESRTEEFKKLNPAHQIPLLIDGDFVLAESRAMLGYLINKYSPDHSLYPSDPRTRAQVDRFLYFDASNLYPAIKPAYAEKLYNKREPNKEQLQGARNAIAELVLLKGNNRFMTGDTVTIADISLAMTFTFVEAFFPEESKPLRGWYEEVEKAVPAVKEINDKVDLQPFLDIVRQ